MTLIRLGRGAAKWCWYSLAGLLVSLALVISLVRALLPNIESVRQDVVNALSNQYGIELSVSRLEADWQGVGPSLTLVGLMVEEQPGIPMAINIRQASVQLDFWASLMDWAPYVKSVDVQGVDLDLNLPDPSMAPSDSTVNFDLAQLQTLTLNDVTLRGQIGQRRFAPVYLDNLNWRYQRERYLAEGIIYLDKARQKDETLRLSLELGERTTGELFGRAYINAEQLKLGDWLTRRLPDSTFEYQGELNMELWASLDGRGLHSALVQFKPSGFSWRPEDSNQNQRQSFQLQSGFLHWQASEQGGTWASQDLKVVTNGEDWSEPKIVVRRLKGDTDLWLSQIPASGLLPIVGLLPRDVVKQAPKWIALKPQGQLGPLKLRHSDGAAKLALSFSDLSWQASGSIPGIKRLTGVATWQNSHGRVELAQQPLTIDWHGQFDKPVTFDQISLSPTFEQTEDELRLTLADVQLANDDLSLELDAVLGFPKAAPARMQLYADAQVFKVGNAKRYLPRKALKEQLTNHLGRAIQAGRSDNVQLLWHGDFKSYPYRDLNGVFQAGFRVDGLKYKFLRQYPAVSEALADVLFENRRMDIWVREGRLGPVSADGAHVWIPELNLSAMLEIEASLWANSEQARQVLENSILAPSVGKAFEAVQFEKPVPVALDFIFPVGAKVKGQRPQVKGSVAFWNTPLTIKPLAITLDNTKGELRFDGGQVDATQLRAELLNQPTQLTIKGQQEPSIYNLDIGLKSLWQHERLPDELYSPLNDYLSGSAQLEGDVALRFEKGQPLRYRASVRSDTSGLTINLPKPVGKEAIDVAALSIGLNGDVYKNTLTLKLADSLMFKGEMDLTSGAGFDQYQLAIGAEALLPGLEGGEIRWRELPFVLDEWQPLIEDFTEFKRPVARAKPWFPGLNRVDLRVNEFELLQQSMGGGQVRGTPKDNGWWFNADLDHFKGQVEIEPDTDNEMIRVIGERLHLIRDKDDDSSNDIAPADWIADLPSLDVSIAATSIGDWPLGRLRLLAAPNGEDYRIEQLSLDLDDHQLSLNGLWSPNGQSSHSKLDGQIRSPDVGRLARTMNTSFGIRDANLESDFSLNWPGAPWAMSLPNLDGEVSFRMDNGSLTDVSDRGARLLSLLSLESLVRKLSLDFRDVVVSGLHFNRFTGNIDLDNGVLQTADAHMDASAGTIKANGWTDLNTRDLNYLISFSPALTSSVPAALFLSTGAWTVGLGAFAVSKVLEPMIEVITQLRYELTGTLDEPTFTEVARDKREVPVPKRLQKVQPDKQTEDGIETLSNVVRNEPENKALSNSETMAQPNSLGSFEASEFDVDDKENLR